MDIEKKKEKLKKQIKAVNKILDYQCGIPVFYRSQHGITSKKGIAVQWNPRITRVIWEGEMEEREILTDNLYFPSLEKWGYNPYE